MSFSVRVTVITAQHVAVAERVFIRFGNGVGPTGNASYSYAKPPVGLYALPLNGLPGVPHTTLFKFAETIIFDPLHSLLLVVRPNNAKGAVVYDVSTWTDADLANPNFAPLAEWPLDEESANRLFYGGSFDFATASDGRPIVIASLAQAPYTRPIILSSINLVNGQIVPFMSIGGQDQYYYYTRYKNLGVNRDPVIFGALDQYPNGSPLLVAINVYANFTNISGVVDQVDMHGEAQIPTGSSATFLELDSTRNFALVGYGADGVVLTNVVEPSSMRYESRLSVSNTTQTFSVGAYQACVRTNAPTSDVAWINVDSWESLAVRNATVNVARFPTTGSIKSLTQEVLSPSSGFVVSCGGFATSSGRGVIVSSTTAIDVFNSGATPVVKLHTVESPCYETYYVGQLGNYGLFFHGDNSTCNCPPSGPCPLGIQVLGNDAVTNNFNAQFGSHLVDGYHFVQPYTCPSLTILANSTLEVQLAQDGNTSATQRQEGCGALVNTNLVGAACLVYRGTCTFQEKITNCVSKGASAVILVNYQNVGLFNPVIEPVTVPVFLVNYEVGEALRLALAAPNTTPIPNDLTPVQPVQVTPPLPPTEATTGAVPTPPTPTTATGAVPSPPTSTGPAPTSTGPTPLNPVPTSSSTTGPTPQPGSTTSPGSTTNPGSTPEPPSASSNAPVAAVSVVAFVLALICLY